MKIPRMMYDQDYPIGRPSVPMRKAARSLEIEAAFHRQQKNKQASWALRLAADALYRVAEGKTFAEAFDWPKEPS